LQTDLDKLDANIARVTKPPRKLLPTVSGILQDRLDSLLNKRLEERIRQLQVFRTQIADIQLKNERNLKAKDIENKKVVDKLRRTVERLEAVTNELKAERSEMLLNPREARVTSAIVTSNVKRSGLVTHEKLSSYSYIDDRKQGPVMELQTNDDGNYWGIGAHGLTDPKKTPARTFFSPKPSDVPKYQPRDWNKEFHTELKYSRHVDIERKYLALKRLAEMQEHFMDTVRSIGCRIINESHVPYECKSLKPTALPKYRKSMSDLDAQDVLKEFVFEDDEWRPVYVFHNILFQPHDDDIEFYGNDEHAMKSLANEYRAQEYLAPYAAEEGLHFPLSAILDFMGKRLLATAITPNMAEPRDLVEVFNTDDGILDDNATSAWDDAQNALKCAVKKLGSSLNIKEHSFTFDGQKEDVVLAADVQLFIDKEQDKYLMGCARILPIEPPTYPLHSWRNHLICTLRPELVQSSLEPVNPDSFSAWAGRNTREDHGALRDLFNRLKKNVIPGVAAFLQMHGEDNPDLTGIFLSKILHRHGINIRFLGLVGRQVQNPHMIRAIASEMVARFVKCDLRSRWRNLLGKGQTSLSAAALRVCQVYNVLLMESEKSEKYWEDVITVGIRKKFPGAIAVVNHNRWRDIVDLGVVSSRLAVMCGISFATDPLHIVSQRHLVVGDVVKLKQRVRINAIVPQSCRQGFQLMYEAFKEKENVDTSASCLVQAREEFHDATITSDRTHPQVMVAYADACLMLAHVKPFYEAREALEEAEDKYRRALSLRPQFTEVLRKLGDVHVLQAKLSRVFETALRLRMRAGSRYLQAVLAEWERDQAIKNKITHSLDHLFQLSPSDFCAISVATKHFTDFEEIDFSTTPEVGPSALRRCMGKRPNLISLHMSGCNNLDNDVMTFIGSKCGSTLEALDISNCEKVSGDGCAALSNFIHLTSLKLDGCLGVSDEPLKKVFESCTLLVNISLRSLPRVTNRSAVYMGKFMTSIETLDMSDSPNITGSIMNEVSQTCPNFRVGKADGCYSIDDVPMITMGRVCKSVEELSLMNCIKVTSLAIRGMAHKCKNLTALNFEGCIRIDDAGLAALSEQDAFPCMRRLNFTMCDMLGSQGVTELVMAHQNLEQLRLGRCTQVNDVAIRRIARMCTSVTDLSLEACVGCNIDATSQISKSLLDLQILNFANCPQVDDVTISVLAENQCNLVDLDLSGCRLITDKVIEALVWKNANLRSLKLYGCPRLGDKSCIAVGKSCNKLEVFSVAISNYITDHGIMQIVTGCPLLKELHATNCIRISKDVKEVLGLQTPWIKLFF
jgi:F-box/leucine-rich repeat protein 2/20